MKQTKIFAALTLVFTAASSMAKPVEIDTQDAHIIVVRPIDDYGIGEQKISARQIEKFEEKTYAFTYQYGDKKDLHSIKATDEENPIPVGVKIAADKYGFTPNGGSFSTGGTSNDIKLPQTLTPKEATEFTQTQNALWKSKVISMGDPSKLVERADGAQTATNWMALGGLVGGAVVGAYAGNAIGSPINVSGGATIGSQLGVSSSFLTNHNDLISFAQLPTVDYSKYKTVDARKITLNNYQRSGSIIIAYKGEKTSQAEQDALIAAIPVLLGFNESVEQVKTARAQDLEARQKVWSEYIAEQAVKKE